MLFQPQALGTWQRHLPILHLRGGRLISVDGSEQSGPRPQHGRPQESLSVPAAAGPWGHTLGQGLPRA